MTATFISTSSAATQRFAASRRSDLRKRRLLLGGMTLAIAAIVFASLMIGRSLTPPLDVIRVLLGETVPGASFTVGQLRLPRALTALAAGKLITRSPTSASSMLKRSSDACPSLGRPRLDNPVCPINWRIKIQYCNFFGFVGFPGKSKPPGSWPYLGA